ncbi:hypothetical protein FOCC_FOCC003196, partial [Frankliniella occidentalis]
MAGLFVSNFNPMSFHVEAFRDYEGLLVHIETNGGHVDPSPTGDHTIEVGDAEPRSMSDKRQLYSAKFIPVSVAGNKLLNLNHYLKHTQNHVTHEETEDMALLRYVIENHNSFGTGPSRTKFYADMHKIFKTRSENAIKHRIESVMLPNLRLYMIPEDSRKILEGLISKQKKPNLEFVNTETRRRVNPRSDKEEEMVPQIVVDGPTEETSRETEGAAPADTAEDYLKYHTLLLEATKREQGWIEESMNQRRKMKEMEEKMEAVVRDREDVKEEVERLRKERDELRKKNGNEAEERFEKERNELKQEILRIKTSRNREKDAAQKQIEEGRATVEQVEE